MLLRRVPGRFVLALLKGGYTYSPEIRGHTFEEIKSVHDLGALRDGSWPYQKSPVEKFENAAGSTPGQKEIQRSDDVVAAA